MSRKKLFICMLLAAGSLGAAELFVAKTGNDQNPGTAEAPFATIAKAAALAGPGDTVKIGPGVYQEQVTFKKSGKKDAPIVFSGTREKDGDFLTVVEGVGMNLTQWLPAPEIGPNSWKTPVAKRPDLILMDGFLVAYINPRTMKLPPWKKELPVEIDDVLIQDWFGPKCKRIPGLDLLKLSKETVVPFNPWPYKNKKTTPFWPLIGNVLVGWRDKFLYVRFADNDKPENHHFTGSYGTGFTIDGASWLSFRDLHLRGSRRQFYLKGNASDITIEKCLLMHGGCRIGIDKSATNAMIRDNILTLGFIRGDLLKHRDSEDFRSFCLYKIFKYIIGDYKSDDAGISDYGKNTRIFDNMIVQGLIGIDAYGPGVEVKGNVVWKMASVGICTGSATVGEFHHNLVMDCGIPLRIQSLRHKRAKREEYHYCNLFIQPKHSGQHIFVHCESHNPIFKSQDLVNFDGDVYKQNPPDPVDAGKFFIYHNTFWGGNNKGWPAAFDVRQFSRRFRMAMPFFVVNNIFKDNPSNLGVKTHELAGPNLLYVFDGKVARQPRREPEVAKVNKVLNADDSQKIWNKNDLPDLPDLTLTPDSPALEVGVDVSKPFTVNGKTYPAFPGLKAGYFKGKAPAAGALQQGESMERFVDMYKRSEAALKMLSGLEEKIGGTVSAR